MQEQQILKAEIISSLDFLPADSLKLLAEFATFLQAKSDPRRRIVRLGGLWAGTPEITTENIADARQEMWGKFGENEI